MPAFSLTDCATATHLPLPELETWVSAIRRKKQAILYGPPGTGKTYLAHALARHLVGGGDGFSDIVQFHPAYAYEDFVQGLRPHSDAAGHLTYVQTEGRFLEFCRQAAQCADACVLIIDEINRADLARVFGELMYLLEYRDQDIILAGGQRFHIPANVYLMGTMNTADRSIALVDHALRRRFAFIPLYPNYDVLRRYHAGGDFAPDGLIATLERLNDLIGDPHYAVGPAFFLQSPLTEHLEAIWRLEIEPYLDEYFFDQPQTVSDFRWKAVEAAILAPPARS